VQYFDKGRMEINDPDANPDTTWYVTSGLLVTEMITGRVQIGPTRSIPLGYANIPVAGDMTNTFPTYASLERFYGRPLGYELGDHVTHLVTVSGGGFLPRYATTAATQVVRLERNYAIPRIFWDFLNRTGTIRRGEEYVQNQPLMANWRQTMGLPVTDPFWVRIRVGGVEREVMIQAFERRLLTYTPANASGFQVELSNVGRHYYRWRYTQPFANNQRALITAPRIGAMVSSPLRVQGFENGRAFEAGITLRLKQRSDGSEIATASTTVMRPDINRPGPFEATLTFAAPAEETAARLEVVVFSADDDSETILTFIDVTLRPARSGS
jgi:hypothetical protein